MGEATGDMGKTELDMDGPRKQRQVEALERIAVALEKLLRLSQLFAASYDVQYGHGVLKEAADELLKMEKPQQGEVE